MGKNDQIVTMPVCTIKSWNIFKEFYIKKCQNRRIQETIVQVRNVANGPNFVHHCPHFRVSIFTFPRAFAFQNLQNSSPDYFDQK